MITDITISEYEIKEIIKQFLLNKGYRLRDGVDQRDTGNWTINIREKEIKVRISM